MKVEIAIPTYKRPEKLCNLVKSILQNKGDIVITIIPDNSGKKVFRILNECSQQSDADIFLGISDDTKFRPDVIEKVVEAMPKDLDAVVSMRWLNMKTVTLGAIAFCGRVFRERFPNKWMYCPDYVSLFADKELGDYAERIGKMIEIKDTGLYHYHPVVTGQEDEAYIKSRETKAQDEETFAMRQSKGYLWGESFDVIR